MDLLVISISGGGIYIIFETLRELTEMQVLLDNKKLLLFSGLSLLLGMITNFTSQVTGYHANTNEECYILQELKKIEGKKFDECSQLKFDKKVNFYNRWTNILNNSSIVFMFLGIVLLAIFNYCLF
ncbi:DUF3899 domain-containing protein [Zobellia roscoffensis]